MHVIFGRLQRSSLGTLLGRDFCKLRETPPKPKPSLQSKQRPATWKVSRPWPGPDGFCRPQWRSTVLPLEQLGGEFGQPYFLCFEALSAT